MLVAALAFVAAPVQDAVLAPVPAADALALFKRVCIDTFPDPVRFAAAMEAESDTYRKRAAMPTMEDAPSGTYTGDRAVVGYAAGDWLPRSLPSPQCRVTTRAEGTADHAALATQTAAALSLPPGKTRGKGRVQTEWNVTGAVDKQRYFLTTMPAGERAYQVELSILNLRGKR